ncbi:hypothetical protein WUBG_12546, partial [Wuchereria bancrofti]
DDSRRLTQVIDTAISVPLCSNPNSGSGTILFLLLCDWYDFIMVMGTGMVENINCSVPEVPLAHLEDDLDFIKVASQQS